MKKLTAQTLLAIAVPRSIISPKFSPLLIRENHCNSKDPEYEMPFPSQKRRVYECPFCCKRMANVHVMNVHIYQNHTLDIIGKLQNDPLRTYKQIFGTENIKRVQRTELKYRDGLVVGLEGKFKGRWWNFLEDTGGGPIRAIMHQNKDLSYAEAVARAADIAGLKHTDLKTNQQVVAEGFIDQYQVDQVERDRMRIETAVGIWNQCQDLKGSLVETYLTQHRHIPVEVIDRLSFKYLESGVEYVDRDDMGVKVRKVNKSPALVVPVENTAGALNGVQRIYVDSKTGNKPKTQHKFSKGKIAGNVGIIQRGAPYGQTNLIVAEGPETCASLTAIVKETNWVLATLSLGNLSNIAEIVVSKKPRRIIVAADNDLNKPTVMALFDQNFRKFVQDVERIGSKHTKVIKVIPDAIDGKDTDWNDVLKIKGVENLRQEFWDKVNISNDY